MARRRLLQPDRWPVLLNLSADEDNLIRNYTMSGDDLDRVLRKRGHHNQLGFAVQLCLMRHTGCQLAQNDAVPAEVVGFIAGQLDISSAVRGLWQAGQYQTRTFSRTARTAWTAHDDAGRSARCVIGLDRCCCRD